MVINLPDGSSPGEIILPDGSSTAEVIGPNGNTVWSASGLEVVASLGSGSGTLTLYEDQTGEGVADTQQTYSIADGTNDLDISPFDLSDGNTIWWDLEVDNADVTAGAAIDSMELKY
jgi:hypothetical protein